jgi:hypothetical protein
MRKKHTPSLHILMRGIVYMTSQHIAHLKALLLQEVSMRHPP